MAKNNDSKIFNLNNFMQEDIIERFEDAYPKRNLEFFAKTLILDLSDTKYQLSDIDDLERDPEYRRIFSLINTLNISQNRVSILILNNYQYLEKINASNNILSKVQFSLARLKKLDLSGNMLDKVPDLSGTPNIEELRLEKNSILRIFYEDFKMIRSTLNTLDMSSNKIDFPRVKDFFDFIEIFGKNMKKLKAFNIERNNFSLSKIYNQDYHMIIIYYCENLNSLNSKNVENTERENSKLFSNFKQRILNNEKNYGKILKNEENLEDSKLKKKEKEDFSLAAISRQMEIFSTLSRMGQSNFEDLKNSIEKYILMSKLSGDTIENKANNINNSFDDLEIENFENFLESCNYIIENNSNLEKPLFDIVANFAIIKHGKFSDRCLTFFKHHLDGVEKAILIEEIIQKTIMKFINSSKEEDIPSSIIRGLESFATDSKFSKLINELIYKLIRIIENFNKIEIIAAKTAQNTEEGRRREIFSASIHFLSILSGDENVIEMLTKEKLFIESIAYHIKSLNIQGEDIIMNDANVLEIMTNLFQLVKEISLLNITDSQRLEYINEIITLGLKDKLELALQYKIDNYQRSLNDKREIKNANDLSVKELKYKKSNLLANMIRCFGSLMKNINDKAKLNFSNSSVVMTLLNLLNQQNFNDPVVASGICDFSLYLLENKILMSNEDDLFGIVSSKLYSFKYFLGFLLEGKPKYSQACIVADSFGENSLDKGNSVELVNLTSPSMQGMIESIINLITFFGKNSQRELPIKQICQQISSDLNDMERDDALTACLSVPSDNVKKAVVQAFFYVDSSEFEAEEIRNIYYQISNVNLTAGDIEEVISTIYIILAKSFKNFMEDPTGNSKEKVENNKDAFLIAFDILLKNQERTTNDEDETRQKLMLSTCLTVFLINCSTFESIRKFYSERKITTKLFKILHYEETRINEEFNLPIEVEKTRTGFNFFNLFDCFKMEFPLSPYSYVFLRVMIHMADLLMNIPYPIYQIDENMEFSEIIEELEDQIQKRENDRVYKETLNFKKIIEGKKQKMNNPKNFIFLSTAELKDEQLKFLNIFQQLLLFLLGKSSPTRMIEYDQIWEDKFDMRFYNINYSLNEIRYNDNEFESSEKKEILDEDFLKTENSLEKVKRYLREESIVSAVAEKEQMNEYDYIKLDYQKYNYYGLSRENLIRIPHEENAHNPYLRGLVIATFLRSIYAILEYPVEKEIKEELIFMLKKGNNIKDLSMLVDSTKLLDFNISTKYLIIMRLIFSYRNPNSKILNSNTQGKKNSVEENEYLNQIGVTSFVIRKMINVYKVILRLENNDHKIFLSELSKTCAVICTEIYSLNYSSPIIKEKTMSKIISYEIIKVFIKIVKDYMNRDWETPSSNEEEANKFTNKNSQLSLKTGKNDYSLVDMINTISKILGEYMAKCKENSYNIIESFTKSYIFEKIKVRKSYLRDIINNCKMSEFEIKIESKYKKRILAISRALMIDYNERLQKVVYLVLNELCFEIFITENSIDYFEWEPKKFEQDQKYIYRYEDIIEIYQLELANRNFFRTKKGNFTFFFMKYLTSDKLIEIFQTQNLNLKVFKVKNIFSTDSNTKQLFLNDENRNDDFDFKNSGVIFYATVKEVGGFLTFFSTIFKDKANMENGKVFFISGDQILLYQENQDYLSKINIDEYLLDEKGESKEYPKNNFIEFFGLYNSYSLSDLTSITFKKTDIIILEFGSSSLEINLFDDYSYVLLRDCIVPVAKEKKFIIDIGDAYSKIK